MSFSKNKDITDLIVPEDDLLSFQTPKFDAVRAAYSKDFKPASSNQDLLQRINEIFPPNSKKKKKKKEDEESSGFNIDNDNDPINL